MDGIIVFDQYDIIISKDEVKMKDIKIDKFTIGKDKPCFIIAEAGVNHNGDV